MSNQPNKPNGAKPAVRKKKNLLDDRRDRLWKWVSQKEDDAQ